MTVAQADERELEVNLLRGLEETPAQARWHRAQAASAVLHIVIIVALVTQAKVFPPPQTRAARQPEHHITLLFAPPKELTQKEPNFKPPSKLFLGQPEARRPPLLITPRELPSAPPPLAKGDLTREEKPPQLTPRPEPLGAGPLTQVLPPPAPPVPPKLVLEDVQPRPGGRQGEPKTGPLAPQRPGSAIEEAVKEASRGAGRSGTVVGDGAGGGVPDGFSLPSPGAVGSNLELLSDPQGVDFKPYLTRILATVRRNWYAVIPESARLGMVRGRVAIQFIIARPGGVTKLVIASPSGHEALNRAAVAGISASNPFPPLPAEYRGDNVRLQFTFLYNIPVQ